MVQFKSWRDFNLLLKNHANYSCLNCKGYHGDMDNGQFVCMITLSPVRLDLLTVCHEWESEDGETIPDDTSKLEMWNFSDEVARAIDKLGVASYEDMLEVINSYEEVKE